MRERNHTSTHRHTTHRTAARGAPRTRLPALLGAAALGGAGLALGTGPAWADCAADIGEFDAALVASETGSATGGEMPATQHQEEVLSGSGNAEGTAGEAPPMETAAGDPTGNVEAISPHQRDVIQALGEDGVDQQTRDTLAVVIAEARAALESGDEAACQAKMEAAREMVRGN